MLNDNQNVTFSVLFKYTMLLLPGSILYVATITPAHYGKNWAIMSLFLMLSLAFIYVILLYIVYTKIEIACRDKKNKSGNRAIRFIYGTRMAVKAGILLYIASWAVRSLMLRKYGLIAVAIPLLAASIYMGSRGFGGTLRFSEALFWFSCFAGAATLVLSLANIDTAQLGMYGEMHEEGGLGATINSVMTRGGLLFMGFSMMEMIMIVYLSVKKRRRGMLLTAVGAATTIGIIGSIIVTITLGMDAISSGEKNILYIVGAMEMPGDIKVRPLMLMCYLLIVWSVLTVSQHIVCGFGVIETTLSVKHPGWWKAAWVLAVFSICAGLYVSVGYIDLYRLIPGYLLMVDIPLSLILPALSVFPVFHNKSFNRLKKHLEIWGALACIILLTSCAYEPIENVDYVNVIIIQDEDEHKVITGDRELVYTMVVMGLNDEETTKTRESIYSVNAESFTDAVAKYESTHAKKLDTSHVEYVVVENEEILHSVCEELESEFYTRYVTVVIERNLLEKTYGENTKEYLKAHYKGRCLATLNKDGGM